MTPSQRPWRRLTDIRRRRLRLDWTSRRSVCLFYSLDEGSPLVCRRATPCRRCPVSLSESPCHSHSSPAHRPPPPPSAVSLESCTLARATVYSPMHPRNYTSPASPPVIPQISSHCRVPETITRQDPPGRLRLDSFSSLDRFIKESSRHRVFYLPCVSSR